VTRAACALTLAIVALSRSTAAQTRELPWNPAVDGAVLGVGSAAWIASEALKPSLAPSTCRWCGADGLDRSAREALVWSDTSAADTASGVIAFGLAPLSAVLTLGLAAHHDGAPTRDFIADIVIVGEAAVLAADVDQLTKFLTGRERPFVHALPAAEKSRTAAPDDNNLSFFSGHTTWTFGLAAAAGTVATMRGYRWAPAAWIAGGALAMATGYLRLAADKHWLTDVAAGMAVGTAAGVLVPYVFHRPGSPADATSLRLSPVPGGAALSFVW
jgi:membrane-associated phospholipid phosphatase